MFWNPQKDESCTAYRHGHPLQHRYLVTAWLHSAGIATYKVTANPNPNPQTHPNPNPILKPNPNLFLTEI